MRASRQSDFEKPFWRTDFECDAIEIWLNNLQIFIYFLDSKARLHRLGQDM